MHIADIVRSRDGSLSQTKLAAACFHLTLWLTVIYLTVVKQEFNLEMWVLYSSMAVGHAVYDKTLATRKDSKDKQLAAEVKVSENGS